MILAQLDVDDVGTAKVRGFNDALTELGSTLTAFGPRAKALNDVTSPDAAAYIGHRLERLGVNRLLARAGAADGDVVWIGDFSFEYRDV